ncbi:ABC transporter ATP-binding protein [Calothrix sp. NIES-3974]|uniref:ABC transporter ATP-binding protein n=1 Tax=Calothrix sp. NIES-3974 TaxID=2005462 RepID=UPI000B5E8370|nr:ABC transporter ATP-binding protein [Calothrix sp. NIES-3974]BAZ06407.1 ABC transporter-related protein [Calothrix sp. NIES-3974]
MIEAVNLTKIYNGLKVVDQVSFQVKEGETLGLLGTSGCGKTTTLKMLNRLIEPDSGRVLIEGEDISKRQPEKLRQRIGYVMQNSGLFPHYTVAENIAVVPRLLGWPKQRIRDRIIELLHLVGLPPESFAHRYPQELSGGQQQRVGLARSLAADPPLILMDEPFGALDQITRSQIQQEFLQLESLLRKTIVIVTHDVFEAVTLCDRICLLNQGKIQQLGTPKQLVFQPQNEFVRDFLAEYQFQLELKVTTVQDLLPWLQPTAIKGNNPQVYTKDTSLLTILEQVKTSLSRDEIVIQKGNNQIDFTTTAENLLSAFYGWKKSFDFGF